MTSRLMFLCWTSALMIVAVVIFALSRPFPKPPAKIPAVDIVFIGTSLTRAAIAQYNGDRTAIAPGRTHFRLGMPSAEPHELLDLFDEGTAGKPEFVILEINHFLFEFNHRRTDNWRGKALESFSSIQLNSLERLRHLAGANLHYEQRLDKAKEAFVDPPGMQDITRAQSIYPLHVRQSLPSPSLVERVEHAKREGVRVAFLMAPRSATGAQYVGSKTSRLLVEESHRVAEELGVDLIDFGTGWDDSLYNDLGHLNSRGQERFMRELRDWFQIHL